tara:strand:+ start:33180 stop:33407 length:228 start_codon:yes stop_codon:yes gene_type:complete
MTTFIAPTIDATTMTTEEICAAWKPVIDQLFDAVIDSAFEGDAVALYEGAMSMFGDDYALATDYTVTTSSDEMPF